MERKKRYDIAAPPPILERALRMVCLKAAASAGAGGWTRDCPWCWGRAGTEAAGGSGVDAAGFCCARSQGAPLGKPWTMEWGRGGEVVVWVSPGFFQIRGDETRKGRWGFPLVHGWAHSCRLVAVRKGPRRLSSLGHVLLITRGPPRPTREESGGDPMLGCSLEGASHSSPVQRLPSSLLAIGSKPRSVL